MIEKNSKEHEVKVLNSVFNDFKDFFEELGYKGYTFESRGGEGVPDGLFRKGSSVIWVEHTQARTNYGEKGSLLNGYDGFSNDVRRCLYKEGKKGCVCFEIPRELTASDDFKSESLEIARQVISSSKEFVDKDRNIRVKYCPPKDCLDDLNEYKGLRVKAFPVPIFDTCQDLQLSLFEQCLVAKEQKFRSKNSKRDENWLFIEEPWGYSFGNILPQKTSYFDKVFIIQSTGDKEKESFRPRLVASREIVAPKNLSRNQLGRIGETAVALELMKRGFNVINLNESLQNFANVDLLCVPTREKSLPISIQVKTSSSEKFECGLIVNKDGVIEDLEEKVICPWVFVHVTLKENGDFNFDFYILTRDETRELLRCAHKWYVKDLVRERAKELKNTRASIDLRWLSPGVTKKTYLHKPFKIPLEEPSKDKWDKLTMGMK